MTSVERSVYKVVETFVSINGEGAKSGSLALFIRFQGCNLHCDYCDTEWANRDDTPYTEWTDDEIIDLVRESKVKNVTLTGGEPLIQKDIDKLIDRLITETDCRIEIETNGTISIEKWDGYYNNLSFTLDYKLPGSGVPHFAHTKNYGYLSEEDTVKFVCSNEEDLDVAREVIEKYSLSEKCNVFLSPVFGKIEPSEIVDYMMKHRMNGVRLQLQLHKFIWDPEKRGV